MVQPKGKQQKEKQVRAQKLKRRLVMAMVLLVLCIIAFSSADEQQPVDANSGTIKIEVEQGASTAQIAAELKEKGLIKSELMFRLAAKLKGVDAELKAGDYALDPTMSMDQIMQHLMAGGSTYTVLTIPEGYTIEQIGEKVERMGLGSKTEFLRVAAAEQFDFSYTQGLAPSAHRLEGFLFPDTYRIPKGASEREIIELMLKRFNIVFTPTMAAQAQAAGMSVNRLITMASLVEREAKVASERPVIASVLYNRLRVNMRLQCDATVQYALGQHKSRLYYKDLKVDSPYNTYQELGLPPGPIANPGKAAIEAALHPDQTDYLYYVTKNDQTHIFSRTYAEHLAAQNKVNKEQTN